MSEPALGWLMIGGMLGLWLVGKTFPVQVAWWNDNVEPVIQVISGIGVGLMLLAIGLKWLL